MDRRQFIIAGAGGVYALMTHGKEALGSMPGTASVALVRTDDRVEGVNRAISLLDTNPVSGKQVLLKPNFNTADPFPASTHNDTLETLILNLKKMGARSITIGERSGPPDTADVIREKGIDKLAERLGVDIINFEDLPREDWVRIKPEESHWINGFDVARPVLDAECVVSTACIKTHGFGGVFTMSLKLSIGAVSKKNMAELHGSFLSMRKMIAEVNQAYTPSLIVLDGMEVFTDGGPSNGTKKTANVILAATDRIAADAAGVAVLKSLGSSFAIMRRDVFEQEQIKRAVELGLGVYDPRDIRFVTDDSESESYAAELTEILRGDVR